LNRLDRQCYVEIWPRPHPGFVRIAAEHLCRIRVIHG
jgi:hypothetical protein